MKLYSVMDAVERATGRRVSPSTCWRWTAKGVRGVRLKTSLLGGRRVTDVVSVQEFLSKLSARPQDKPPKSVTREKIESLIRRGT